jgi:hypothetical protein
MMKKLIGWLACFFECHEWSYPLRGNYAAQEVYICLRCGEADLDGVWHCKCDWPEGWHRNGEPYREIPW